MVRVSVLPRTAYPECEVEEPVLGLDQGSLSVHAVDDEFTMLSTFDIVSVSTFPPRFSGLAGFRSEFIVGICFCVLLSLPLPLSPSPQRRNRHSPAPLRPPLSIHHRYPCPGDPPARFMQDLEAPISLSIYRMSAYGSSNISVDASKV
jgi:hypothetical protein